MSEPKAVPGMTDKESIAYHRGREDFRREMIAALKAHHLSDYQELAMFMEEGHFPSQPVQGAK